MKTLLSACVLIIASTTAEAAETSSGSGVVIGTQGEILTNSHVVEDCRQITVQFSSGVAETAALIEHDQKNDLAVVRTGKPTTPVATFRDSAPVRAGDAIVALGYPLSGLLASAANVSVGNVSALAGLGDDTRYLQISAPVQPGNSGGPLLDASGYLIGIVTAKLNAVRVAKFTGDIPQNVNFALKVEVARTFLDSKDIGYRKASSDQQLSPADVGDIARPFTVHIKCEQTAFRTEAIARPSGKMELTRQQMQHHIEQCYDSSKTSADLTIAGCSAVILQAGPCGGTVCGDGASWAYKNRAVAYMRNDNFADAINDLTKAIQIDPTAEVLRLRGGAYSAKGDFDRAFADWTRSIGIFKNAGAYWLLWNYILSGHAKKGGVPWTEMNRDLAAGVKVARLHTQTWWPFPVIELYLGNRSETELISAGLTPNEQCEAQFYIGEWHSLHGNRVAATTALRRAAATCPKNFYEYDGAVAELKRLNQ